MACTYRPLLGCLLERLAKLVRGLAFWLDKLARLDEISQLRPKNSLPVALKFVLSLCNSMLRL